MWKAKAFAPCHITGVFQIFDQQRDALDAGSRGAGVSLSRGIETTVEASRAPHGSVQVRVKGSAPDSAHVSKHVINIFSARFPDIRNYDISVEHCVSVPIGAGLGTSGAGALSLALALNEALSFGLSKIEAAQIAHTAEVECRTGLGTVIAETCGGLEIRVNAGAPGVGKIERLRVADGIYVAVLVFGPLSTRKYLTDESTRERINEFGGKMVDKLIETPIAEEFMRLSRQFAEHVGLFTERVRQVLEATDKTGVVCSMPMFGESVFTLAKPRDLEKVLQVFRNNSSSGQIITSDVDQQGARLL
jgi:pantoate kinase